MKIQRFFAWGWKQSLAVLACAQIAGALLGFIATAPWTEAAPTTPYPLWIYFLHLVVFSAAAAFLIFGSRRDRRAIYLGFAYLLAASAFSYRPFIRLIDLFPGSAAAFITLLAILPATAFLPYFLWRFFQEFPRGVSDGVVNRVHRYFLRLSLGIGVLLFFVGTAGAILGFFGGSGSHPLISLFESRGEHNVYWILLYGMLLPALVFAGWQARTALPREKRRVGFFISGLALGIGPIVLEGLLETFVPGFSKLMDNRTSQIVAGIVVYPLLLSVPLTTTYSVLVDRVLDVKVVFRKALRYAMARYSVLLAAALPFLGLIAYVYSHRDEPVGRLFQGPGPLVLLSLCLAGVVAIRLRRRVIGLLDRRFFREAYDAQHILVELVEKSRAARSLQELGNLLSGEIDRALHLTGAAVFTIDSSTGFLVSHGRRYRPLSVTSSLVTLLAAHTQALEVDEGNDPQSPLARLPLEDRQWLADGAFHLLIPLFGSDGSLFGIIALGEKRSELPYSNEDRRLLTTVAASGALALESRLFRTTPSHNGVDSPAEMSVEVGRTSVGEDAGLAAECLSCHRLEQSSSVACSRCGGRMLPASVPYVLPGKFRFEERVGSGGMGVVYRAVDLTLGRDVAIKTLPSMSPGYSLRLRREARAMATVEHPNLAMIFGAETWRGTPMLVFEYLDGGTLRDRIRQAPWDLPEAVDLGMNLVEVLEKIHAAGILHRDIKPSNIGFTNRGQPKLLDFGLAHILFDSRLQGALTESDSQESSQDNGSDTGSSASATLKGNVAGTPAYLSPEAIRGVPPEPSFDLWSLGVLLYEILTGTNPLLGENVRDTLTKVASADIPDIREERKDLAQPVAQFFRIVLSRNRRRRPRSARSMKAELEQLRNRV